MPLQAQNGLFRIPGITQGTFVYGHHAPKKGPPVPNIPSLAVPMRPVTSKHRLPGLKFLGALCLRGRTLVGGRVRGSDPAHRSGSGPLLPGLGPTTPQHGGVLWQFSTCMSTSKSSPPGPQGIPGHRVHLDACVGLRTLMRLLTAGGPH